MPDTIDILFRTTADLKGAQQIQQAIQGLTQAMGRAAGGGAGGLAKPLADAGAAAARSEKDILRYASALASAQKAQGDVAGAANTWKTALSQITPNTIEAHRATTQLAQAQNLLSGQAQGLNGALAGLGQQLSGIGGSAGMLAGSIGNLAGSLGTLGTIGAAIGIAKVGFDLAQVGAQAEQTRTRFDQLAVAAGTTGDAMLAALRKASGGTISDTALQLDAMKASILGVAHNAEELGPLLAIARDRAQQMGISVEFAFDSLVTGLGRGSRLILDNIGVMVKTGEVNAAYAKSIGKTVDQLTEQEQKQALVNEVLRQGNETMAKTGGAVEGTATALQRSATDWENLKTTAGKALANVVGASYAYRDGLVNAGVAVREFILGQKAHADAVNAAADTMESARDRERAATNAARDSVEAYRASEVQAAANAEQSATAQLALANSMELSGVRARAAKVAAEQKSNADQVAAVDAQTHAVANQQLAQQASDAAHALLAAGPAGANTAAMLAGSSSQVDVMTAAYYRLYAAMQAVGVAGGKAAARKEDFAERHGGEAGGALTPAARNRAAEEQRINDQINANKLKGLADTARQEQIIATGTHAQKVAELQREYREQVAQHGAESAEAIRAQTKLLQAEDQGSKARTSKAAAAADKLENIELKTGDKLAEIVADAQKKITEITEREAKRQAELLEKLNDDIATSAADRRAQDEADDLELIGVKDKNRIKDLNNREKAEAKARASEAKAAEEAKKLAESGAAEAAGEVLKVREGQIGDQQKLDEEYYKKQTELAGNPEQLAALQKQYEEGTKAIDDAATVRIEIAKRIDEEHKKAVADEQVQVIISANDMANKVGQAAEIAAGRIKNATGSAKKDAVADLQAIGNAVVAIPSEKTITITTVQNTTTGTSTPSAGGGTKSAGGGTFMTHGPANLTVGDNPGGMELVSVTPVSGTGTTIVGGGMTRLAGGGLVLIDAGGGYTTPVAGSDTGGGKGKGKGKSAPDLKKQLDEQKNIVELLKAMIELRGQLEEAAGQQPFNMGLITNLARRSAEFLEIVKGTLVPITKKQGENFKAYTDAAKSAIDILKDVADLRGAMQERVKDQPFNMGLIRGLAARASEFTKIVQSQLVPVTEFEATQMGRYKDIVSDVVGIFKDVADLRKELTEGAGNAFDMSLIDALAVDAAAVVTHLRSHVMTIGEDEGKALGAYQDAVSASVSIIKDVADLQKTLADGAGAAFDMSVIDDLVARAEAVSARVRARIPKVSEDEAKALDAYHDAVGSSVGILKDISEINQKMFADYSPPTDEQIAMLAKDAERIARGFIAASKAYDTKTLEAAKLYNDAVGGTFSNVKEGLLAIQALNSGDFVLQAGVLDKFEAASAQILGTTQRLGAIAGKIPSSDIAALQNVTAAETSLAEMWIKMAAVPWGDLPAATGGFAGQSGGMLGGASPITVNVYGSAGMDVNALANAVMAKLGTATGMRR